MGREAIPLKDVDKDDVVDFIEEHLVYIFGIPETLTTDQGTVFNSILCPSEWSSRGYK